MKNNTQKIQFSSPGPWVKGRHQGRDVWFDFSSSPLWLQKVISRAKWIGGGASSCVWSLKNGYVMKVCYDKNVIQWAFDLMELSPDGFPEVWAVLSQSVASYVWGQPKRRWQYLESYGQWSVVIQKQYQPVSGTQWKKVHRSMKQSAEKFMHQNPGKKMVFSRDVSGIWNSCHQEAIDQLKVWKQHAQQEHLSWGSQVNFLYGYFKKNQGVSLDVDHSDNWACDEKGRLICLDPLI